jgi:hypothetical protein
MATLEHLYDAGLFAIAGRRGFERLYDITERVLPRNALDAPVPPPKKAMKQPICLAANAYGVGTCGDIIGYFNIDGWRDRMPPGPRWMWTNAWTAIAPRRSRSVSCPNSWRKKFSCQSVSTAGRSWPSCTHRQAFPGASTLADLLRHSTRSSGSAVAWSGSSG